MNIFKSYLLSGLAAMATVVGFTGCQDDFDDHTPAVEIPKATLVPNTSILELKQTFWQDEVNYIATVGEKENGEHYIVAGRVISSDRAGNVYKKLVIQDKTAALPISINANSLFQEYRVGQEIVIDVTGMYIGKYNGTQQLGYPMFYEKGQVWEATFMSNELFNAHRQLNGLPDAALIDTINIRKFADLPTVPADFPAYQGQLVRFNNVHFLDGGEKALTDGYRVNTNRILVDADGQSITVRTSGYANFREVILPEGNGDVVAILDYYATSQDADSPWQLTLIDEQGLMNFGNPTLLPGAEDNPYTISELIEIEAAGKTDRAWATGYIVGAVAPEVTTVSSNDDIEWSADVVLANTLVVAENPDCKDWRQAVIVPLVQDSPLYNLGNLRDNPDNYQKQIWIFGSFENYMGSWGITGNSGAASQFRIDGVATPGAGFPEGSGAEDSPYNVGQVIALNPTATDASPAGGSNVWVRGYIVGSMPTGGTSTTLSGTNFSTLDAATTNIVVGPTADCTDYTKCIGIQLPTGNVRNNLNLSANPGNLGKEVALLGDVMKYCGGPGLKNTSKYVLGEGGSGNDPVTPPAGDGNGTVESPYSVAQALAAIQGGFEGEAVVKGIVSVVSDLSTSYGNATYTIKDNLSDADGLIVYRGYYLNGEKFTSEDQLKVGMTVVVSGSLVNYFGNTPEFTSGSKIISIDGQGGGSGDDPVTPPAGDGDGTENNPFACSQVIALNPTSTTAVAPGGSQIWVEGYIVGYIPTGGSSTVLSGTVFAADANAANTNMVIAPTPDCTDYNLCVGVQLPTETAAPGVRSALNLKDNPGVLGKHIKLFGDVMKYCGGPGLKNTSKYIFYDGGGNVNPDPDPDPVTPPVGDGNGTLESPYSVAQALAAIQGGFEGEAVVKGIISVVTEVSTSYGNATYTIKDNLSDAKGLIVYRGYYLNGDKFTSADQLKVGMNVVVSGSLVNYAGNTPEFTTGSKIISIDGQGGGSGDDPVTPPVGDGDGTKSSPYDCAQVIALNPTSTSAAVAGGSDVWVRGYIVGYIPTSGSIVLSAAVFAADANAANTNMVLGPTADCTDYTKCISVQLPTESAAPGVRASLNLKDNPGNLGKEVLLNGDVMKYCSGPGLKNTRQFEVL